MAVMSRRDSTDDGQASRLAEALRENLRKRKVQARARKQADRPDGSEPAAADTTTRRDGADRPRD